LRGSRASSRGFRSKGSCGSSAASALPQASCGSRVRARCVGRAPYICIHTYIHTYIHTIIHTYIHTYMRSYHINMHRDRRAAVVGEQQGGGGSRSVGGVTLSVVQAVVALVSRRGGIPRTPGIIEP
jgi:hypothetical protein